MPKVHNWQLNREMEYPYPEAHPKRQVAWVFDTNKCIACQTCSMACKMTWTSGRGQEYMFWNNVETKPYGGYPTRWDLSILEKIGPGVWKADGTYQGKTVFEAADSNIETVAGILPGDDDWAHPNIGEDQIAGPSMPRGFHETGEYQSRWFFYLPRICNHCTYPACLGACPRKAIYKRPEDGIVLIDQSRCRGYRRCVKACPYGKSMFRPNHEVSEKCIGCYPKIEQGLQTQCTEMCIGKLRGQGFLSKDAVRPDNPIDYLIRVRKIALPLYPQFGTAPNVYYIPPIHVPPDYLTQMFGPGVEAAQKAYRGAATDESLVGLLVLFGSSPQIMERFDVKDGVARGFNKRDELVAQAPLVEPHTIRAPHDEKLGVHRIDVT